MGSVADRREILRYAILRLLSHLNFLDNLPCKPLIGLTEFLAKTDSCLIGMTNDSSGDKPDLGFSAFAVAAFFRTCRIEFVAPQRASRFRTFKQVLRPEFQTNLSPRV